MSDYTQLVSYGPKDSLSTGDPDKLIRGTQFDAEFAAIAAAILTKFDSTDIASQAHAEALVNSSTLLTPERLGQALTNGTWVTGLTEETTASSTDVIAMYDTSASVMRKFSLSNAIADDLISNAKMANMAEATIKGRATGAGTGDPTDLTAAQLIDILETADGAGTGLDADTLDGVQGSDYARISQANTLTATNTFTAEGTATAGTISLSADQPVLLFRQDSAAANNGVWLQYAASEQLRFEIWNDAGNSGTAWLHVDRTGSSTVDTINFVNGTLQYGGREVGYRSGQGRTTTGTYTLVLDDAGRVIQVDNTVTVPPNSSVAFPTWTMISIYNSTSGNITISPGVGVTLALAGTATTGARTLAQFDTATLLKVSTNSWIVKGVS